MAFRINNRCINCDACESECPNEAIFLDHNHCQIRPELCTQCVGHYAVPQCDEVCPVDCIEIHPDWRETPEQLQAKYQKLSGRMAG